MNVYIVYKYVIQEQFNEKESIWGLDTWDGVLKMGEGWGWKRGGGGRFCPQAPNQSLNPLRYRDRHQDFAI